VVIAPPNHAVSRALLLLRCKSRRRLFGTRPAHNRLDAQDAAAFLSPNGAAHNSPAPEQKKAAATKKGNCLRTRRHSPLQYTEQVEQLGFTKAAAKDFSIGFYRGQVYIPIRHCDGSINGFVGYADGQMKLPPKWLPATCNVVTFSKKQKECVKKSPA
jgi:hypothetical protein